MTSIPFIDVVAFKQKPTDRTLFHALVHVTQFTILGVEQFMELYARGLNKKGTHILISLVQQAYKLDSRYTKESLELVFAVLGQRSRYGRTERCFHQRASRILLESCFPTNSKLLTPE